MLNLLLAWAVAPLLWRNRGFDLRDVGPAARPRGQSASFADDSAAHNGMFFCLNLDEKALDFFL